MINKYLKNKVKYSLEVFKLIVDIRGLVEDVNLSFGRLEVGHRELLGEGAHEERAHRVDGRHLIGKQGPLGLVTVDQEHKT